MYTASGTVLRIEAQGPDSGALNTDRSSGHISHSTSSRAQVYTVVSHHVTDGSMLPREQELMSSH